jgi:RNA polymerase sigma-70 factor (ECF subfamily)
VPIEEFSETLAGQEAEAVSEHDMSRILASLSAGQRAVVTALSVEGRSISETAGQLKVTETAVRVAFHRGLAAIKRRFGH